MWKLSAAPFHRNKIMLHFIRRKRELIVSEVNQSQTLTVFGGIPGIAFVYL
jgi:hypothetical protein